MGSPQGPSAAEPSLHVEGLAVVLNSEGSRRQLGPFGSVEEAQLARSILAAKVAGVRDGPAAAACLEDIARQLQGCSRAIQGHPGGEQAPLACMHIHACAAKPDHHCSRAARTCTRHHHYALLLLSKSKTLPRTPRCLQPPCRLGAGACRCPLWNGCPAAAAAAGGAGSSHGSRQEQPPAVAPGCLCWTRS
ncbi:hypothetical protein ABPG75_012023 [Micractinium tetrahymenae]